MTKRELIEEVARASGLSVSDATKAVDALLDNVGKALASGDEVQVSGFGKFAVAQRAARAGRNPLTGETIAISPSKSISFSAATRLRRSLAGDPDETF